MTRVPRYKEHKDETEDVKMEVRKRDVPPHINLDTLTPTSLRTLEERTSLDKSLAKRKKREEIIPSAVVEKEEVQISSTKKRKKKDKKTEEDRKEEIPSEKRNLDRLIEGNPVGSSKKKRKTTSAQEDNSSPKPKKRKTNSSDPIALSERHNVSAQPQSSSVYTSRPSQTALMPSNSTSNDTFITRNGTILAFQNSGQYLLHWAQAVGQNELEVNYRNVPSTLTHSQSETTTTVISKTLQRKIKQAELEGREMPKPETPEHQGTLRECSFHLPIIGTTVHSSKPLEGGWMNKKLAKQSASFEAIKILYKLGKVDDNLKIILSSSSSDSTSSSSSLTSASESTHSDSTAITDISTTGEREEELRLLNETRLMTKSRSTQRWDKQKELIKDRLPPSPSESSSSKPTGQHGLGSYESYISPPFWAESRSLNTDCLYATTLEFILESPYQQTHKIDEKCRKLCLVTSRPLDIFDKGGMVEINLTIGDQQLPQSTGYGPKFKLVDYGRLKYWSEEDLDKALKFTKRLLRAELQKPFKGDLARVKWLLVPLKSDFIPFSSLNKDDDEKKKNGKEKKKKKRRKLSEKDISWEEISKIVDGPLYTSIHLDDMDILKKQCIDRMITSPSEFARRKYITSVRFDLSLDSPHPANPARTIVESLPSGIPPLGYSKQPILQCENVRPYKSGGIMGSILHPIKAETSYIAPELTKIHCIPCSIYRTGTVLPYLFDELDNHLIANQANKDLLNGMIDGRLLKQALTTPGSNMILSTNYERLEFLGDTILKFIITLYFYLFDLPSNSTKSSNLDSVSLSRSIGSSKNGNGRRTTEEFDQDRHVITSNRSLQHNALEVGLNKYIRNKRFKSKEWLPKDWILNWDEWSKNNNGGEVKGNPSLKGLESKEVLGMNDLGDKILADVLEAIIGASYLTSRNFDNVISVVHSLGIPIKGLNAWSDIKHLVPTPSFSHKTTKDEKVSELGEAKYMKFFKAKGKTILGYEFKDENRLNQVLSLDMNQPGHRDIFDRYRLLGNAILDYFVVEYLYDKYPEEGPSSLHLMKLTRCPIYQGARSALSTELGLLDLLKDGTVETTLQITKIRKVLKAAKTKTDQLRSKAKAAESDQDHSKVGLEYWMEVPTSYTTSNPLEALFGAILHDSSFDIQPLRQIFQEKLLPFLEKYCTPSKSKDTNPKAELIRYLQSRGCITDRLIIEKKVLGTNDGKVEVIVNYHGVEVSRETVEEGLGFKAVKDRCAFALGFLRDQGGLEKICDCKTKKR
ncbi:hypothetical protein L486_06931 [Kwoniella mangroviensis CBS 10435]|uniref:RNase III domain-containing protein n=1 Tax=Kwoniella mangroviensis CBS 10435 TaxID=1331196 RepID=A0A1B9IIF5_9TREE|nr:hypothetical protein L486_06931 [Kwoniella mangroviensis CBS 10435]